MGRSYFLCLLLLLALFSLSFSQGFGRRLMMERVEVGDQPWVEVEAQDNEGKSREIMEVMDYDTDPKANTNPNTGFIYGPPPGPPHT